MELQALHRSWLVNEGKEEEKKFSPGYPSHASALNNELICILYKYFYVMKIFIA